MTYVRDDVCIENMTATPGASTSFVDDQVGVLEVNELDWVIRPSEFGDLDRPKRGDLIKVSKQGRDYEYEVSAFEGDEPPWRYTDAHHTFVRVHTTRIRQIRTE